MTSITEIALPLTVARIRLLTKIFCSLSPKEKDSAAKAGNVDKSNKRLKIKRHFFMDDFLVKELAKSYANDYKGLAIS